MYALLKHHHFSLNSDFQVHVLLRKENTLEKLDKRIIYLKSLINRFTRDLPAILAERQQQSINRL